MCREHGQILRRVVEQHCGGRHGGGFETCPEEHDGLGRRTRDIDHLRHAVDDVHGRAFGTGVGQGAGRTRHAHHVAIRGNAYALKRQSDRLVDLRHVGDAHRTAWSHDDVQIGRQRGAEAEASDRLLMTATDVHHRYRAVGDRTDRSRERLAERTRPGRIAEFERSGHRPPSISLRTSAAMRSSGPCPVFSRSNCS